MPAQHLRRGGNNADRRELGAERPDFIRYLADHGDGEELLDYEEV